VSQPRHFLGPGDSPVRTRRQLLLGFASASLLGAADISPQLSDYTREFQVEAQDANPRVRCLDLRHLTQVETATRDFFLFHQTKTMTNVEAANWRLHITGCVERPMSLTLSDLRRRPAVELPVTIECSGNSGHPRLMNGLVSHATWQGPALAPLLRECGIRPEAREIVFFGMDGETERKWAAREQEMYAPHGRSIFVQDALNGSAVLAMRMNGAGLPADHGYPLRLVLPGWYGMTQVKWLNRIVVLDRRYEGRHMARNYHSIHGSESVRLETSISRMRLKSVVTRVTRGDSDLLIHGAAWTGGKPVSKVEVRVDHGPWLEATLSSAVGAWAWRLWTLPWLKATAGKHTIVSRAVDDAGEVQPEPHEWRRRFASSREDNSQWTRTVVLA
jgi:DMSO/TMAO reductase YedYZ molybdopterin-dependent catalytic subunit